MGLINYNNAKKLYSNDIIMIQVIEALESMDEYHLLRGTSVSEVTLEWIPETAIDYKRWLSVCDGGLLFSTTLLCSEEYDEELSLSFSTLGEWNTSQKQHLYNLPRGYFIIALLNYGDPICISQSDQKIYLWDSEELYFSTIWDSLADFLADEYNTAVQMEEDGVLEPIPLKIGFYDAL